MSAKAKSEPDLFNTQYVSLYDDQPKSCDIVRALPPRKNVSREPDFVLLFLREQRRETLFRRRTAVHKSKLFFRNKWKVGATTIINPNVDRSAF